MTDPWIFTELGRNIRKALVT